MGKGRSLEGEWPRFVVPSEFWSEGPEDQVQDDSLSGQMLWGVGWEVTANYNIMCNILRGIDIGGPRVMENVG